MFRINANNFANQNIYREHRSQAQHSLGFKKTTVSWKFTSSGMGIMGLHE